MATSGLIAETLLRAKQAAEAYGGHIVKGADLNRSDRERLLKTGWLQEIMRGWYMIVRPDLATGDSAAWYANFWDFVGIYLRSRFSEQYCLSAECSLDIHVESPTVPKQVIVIEKRSTSTQKLLYDTSLMMYKDVKNFPKDIVQKNHLNVMSLPLALCKAPPSYFQNNQRDVEIALRLINSPHELVQVIVKNDFKNAAARLIGAYQFINHDDYAHRLQADLLAAGIDVYPENPFLKSEPLIKMTRIKSPYYGRIGAMWADAREAVITNFPHPPGLPDNPEHYLQRLDEVYQYDAYHSLSIEGYQVSLELINRVKDSRWNPGSVLEDRNSRNAMAAKGYYDTFLQVKNGISRILQGEDAAKIVKENLQSWFIYLFGPSVQAGILTREQLSGYRDDRVFIRNSRHSPPPKEAVLDAMEAFFECLDAEEHPAVNAILGHYIFVYIHPYMDGNGRISRFLMNTMLASGGYPWTIVKVENRNQYISTLEETHSHFDLTDFTKFIASQMMSDK